MSPHKTKTRSKNSVHDKGAIARTHRGSAVGVAQVALFEALLNDAVSATGGQCAIGVTRAIRPVIDAVIAGLTMGLVEDAVAATRRLITASESTMSIGAVIDAIVAHFAEPGLDDAVTANGLFTAVGAPVIVDAIAVVAFLAGFDDAIAASDDAAGFGGTTDG